MTVPGIGINRHTQPNRYVSLASFPVRYIFFASRDHCNTFCSVTVSLARATSASNSFLGMTTRSSLEASFRGIVMVVILSSVPQPYEPRINDRAYYFPEFVVLG